jgi:hypothetical protein
MNDNEPTEAQAAKTLFDYLTQHQVFDLDAEEYLGRALKAFFQAEECPVE